MIIRCFRACVYPNKVKEFRDFFLSTALPLVRRQEGLIRAEIGWPMPPSEDEFLMITVWRDLEALKAFSGENWQQARILDEERELLREVFLHHYEVAGL